MACILTVDDWRRYSRQETGIVELSENKWISLNILHNMFVDLASEMN